MREPRDEPDKVDARISFLQVNELAGQRRIPQSVYNLWTLKLWLLGASRRQRARRLLQEICPKFFCWDFRCCTPELMDVQGFVGQKQMKCRLLLDVLFSSYFYFRLTCLVPARATWRVIRGNPFVPILLVGNFHASFETCSKWSFQPAPRIKVTQRTHRTCTPFPACHHRHRHRDRHPRPTRVREVVCCRNTCGSRTTHSKHSIN